MSSRRKSPTALACGNQVPLARRGPPLSSCCASQKPATAAHTAATATNQRARIELMGELFHSGRPARAAAPTVRRLIERGAARLKRARVFFGHGTDNAWDEAAALVWHALALPQSAEAALYGRRVGRAAERRVRQLFSRRIQERLPAA